MELIFIIFAALAGIIAGIMAGYYGLKFVNDQQLKPIIPRLMARPSTPSEVICPTISGNRVIT